MSHFLVFIIAEYHVLTCADCNKFFTQTFDLKMRHSLMHFKIKCWCKMLLEAAQVKARSSAIIKTKKWKYACDNCDIADTYNTLYKLHITMLHY